MFSFSLILHLESLLIVVMSINCYQTAGLVILKVNSLAQQLPEQGWGLVTVSISD